MMKIRCFLSIILIIFLFQLILFPKVVKAEDIGTVVSEGDSWIKDSHIMINEDNLKKSQSFIFNALLAAGTIITVFIGGFLGIKFMLASAEDKADIKQTLIPYIIGCLVIYGAFGIWKIIITVLDSM